MWGFLSAIPSIFGKGLQTAGQGIATGAKTVGRGIGQIPQRLGMGGETGAMARTPDFVPPVRGGMEGIAPRALASMNPMRQMPAMPEGAGFNALTGGGASPMPDLPMRDMNIGGGLTNMAKAAEAAKPALEQYPNYVDPIRQKRDEFVNDRLEGRARWKQMVIPALLGAASQGGSGDPARMLGGALGGFGMGAFAPKQALEGEYEMREGGVDREELGREQDWRQAQARLQQMRGQEEIARKRLEQEGLIAEQKNKYQLERDRIKDEQWKADQEQKNKPRYRYGANVGVFDEGTGDVKVPVTAKPLSRTDELKDIEADEIAREGTVDSIAQSSTQEKVKQGLHLRQLPAEMRQILEKGTVVASERREQVDKDGYTTGKYETVNFERKATPSEIAQAKAAEQAAIKRMEEEDKRYTQNVRQRNVNSRRGGGQRPASGGGAPNLNQYRSRSEMMGKLPPKR